jgi:hypothetical protein
MKIRLMGLPSEVEQAAKVISDTKAFDVIEVDGPYPNRGNSRMVRIYAEVQLRDGSEATP